MSKKRLGKGLSALLPTLPQEEALPQGDLLELPLDIISLNPRQPRQHIDEEGLAELAASVREHGILQPVIVQRQESGYALVAGERRFRAARLAGMDTIPAVVKELTQAEAMEVALIENLQREDLNPLEEAQAYRELLDEFGFTQEQLARRIGKSRPTVANMLRLLQLPRRVRQLLAEGQLSMGHARTLLALRSDAGILAAAEQVVQEGLSVRATEERVNTLLNPPDKKKGGKTRKENPAADPFSEDLEEQLRHHLGCQVKIRRMPRGGKLEISYFNEEELERIVELILEGSKLY